MKSWKLITLSRGGLALTHLCFTDDLFIFAKAFMSQVDCINFCLNAFYESSRQKN